MARNVVQQFRVAAQETRAATQQALVTLAKAKHAEVMTSEPRPRRFARLVDGVAGAKEEQVRVDGTIIYRYYRLDEVVQAAMDLLFQLSPVLSGEYRSRHTIFVDGVAAANLKDWDGKAEVMISNLVPYARKIEVGKMTMRVPGTEMVYQQAEEVLARRFGNQASIFFTFRGIVGGNVVGGSAGNKHAIRYPALIIRGRG